MANWVSSAWQRWRVKRYRKRQVTYLRTDRGAQEHIERLEQGIRDSPRAAP